MRRIVVASIIGIDRFTTGYLAAKRVHERAMLAGPIPVLILRAAQFHEFVEPVVNWGRHDGVSYVADMRTQLVAARTVAEALADLATTPDPAPAGTNGALIPEIAGPRAESFVEMARLLTAHRGEPVRIENAANPAYPDAELYEQGALLPGPDATLAGPTFEEWLEANRQTETRPREEEVTMKYLLQNYADPETVSRLSAHELEAIRGEYIALLQAPGVFGGEQLQPSTPLPRSVSGGRRDADRPMAPSRTPRSSSAASSSIEADDLDAALELARGSRPRGLGGAVEVRPLVER